MTLNLKPTHPHHLAAPKSHHSIVSLILPNPDPTKMVILPNTHLPESKTFQEPKILDQSQAVKHAVSQLSYADSGMNIVQIIFKTGWTDPKNCEIHGILKTHKSGKRLPRFGSTESVKCKMTINDSF